MKRLIEERRFHPCSDLGPYSAQGTLPSPSDITSAWSPVRRLERESENPFQFNQINSHSLKTTKVKQY